MPVSDPNNITPIIMEVCRLRPSTLLDLGVGYGVYGVLSRQYLDVEQGRLTKPDWRTIICGVEGFNEYSNANWDAYTLVENDDFSSPDHVVRYEGFDLVLMIDSLEHLEAKTGHWLLDCLIEQNKHVIVSVPIGSGYAQQGAVNGNEFERHRTAWTPDEFEVRGAREIHKGVCGVYSIPGRRRR